MIDKILDVALWVGEKLRLRPDAVRIHRRKRILKELLSEPNPKWRTMKILTERTGATEQECRNLLVEIKARGSRNKNDEEIWGLIKRVGLH